ncbi:MAG: adenylate/guanylate cyclase domain-containing protein, partial [Gemmataceae bacterium]
ELLRGNQEASLVGERRVLTLCFCDLRDSTTIAESMAPEAFVEQLREYLGSLSEAIVESAGTVDKFIGDAVMAFWGAPTPLEDHALCACRAALRCQQRMRELRKLWEARGLLPFHTRIGINSGEVVVGNIGSVTRLNYTAIGDPVNLAARLEGVNKVYGTEIIISAHTRRMAGDAVIVRPLGGILVKGKTEAVQIYELLGLKGECDEAQFAWAAIHAEGVDEYGKRHWRAAIERFERVLALKPGDGAAKFMIEQCRRYEAEPPPEDWSALYRSDVH